MSTLHPYTHLVFIGRFQPFHIGHLEVIRTALQQADHVIILVGSSFQPRTEKNPWTFMERSKMIYDALGDDVEHRVKVMPLRDQKYNDQKWAAGVQNQVNEAIRQTIVEMDDIEPKAVRFGIIGHTKDESSYYLKMFPQWSMIEHTMNEAVNATDIRHLYFDNQSVKYIAGVLPDSTLEQVVAFKSTLEYANLKLEFEMVKKYKKAWLAAPYAPTFVTTDAIVICSGHALLIKRGAAPGFGLWALPGGFLEQKEYIIDGMLRELREETKLKVPAPVLKGSIKATHVFDRPDRSSRGRTITHAFFIELPAGPLPAIKGSDDAMEARWVPFADIREDQMFEDHFHILQHFIDID